MQLNDPGYAKLLELFKGGRLLRFRNREIILRAAEEQPSVFCIAHGFVKVYSITDRGEENIHITYRPGEIFPLVWILRNVVKNIFYESLGATKIWKLAKEDFLSSAATSPDISRALLLQLTDQFDVYSDRIDNLEYTDARERVVYALLFLAGRFGQKQQKKVIIGAPMTHHHIASSINLARETVSREIEKLEHEGLVSHRRRQIILKDIKSLKNIIGEPSSPNFWGV